MRVGQKYMPNLVHLRETELIQTGAGVNQNVMIELDAGRAAFIVATESAAAAKHLNIHNLFPSWFTL